MGGKYGAMGAGIGSAVPGIGTVAGGIAGSAVDFFSKKKVTNQERYDQTPEIFYSYGIPTKEGGFEIQLPGSGMFGSSNGKWYAGIKNPDAEAYYRKQGGTETDKRVMYFSCKMRPLNTFQGFKIVNGEKYDETHPALGVFKPKGEAVGDKLVKPKLELGTNLLLPIVAGLIIFLMTKK